MIERLTPPGAPTPVGPYSPVVRAGDFVFVSGHVPADLATGQVTPGSIQDQTRLTLQNVLRALAACGATAADVVKVNVYLKDPGDWAAMNEVYAEVFSAAKPARTTVAVGFAHPDLKVEIDCIAYNPR
jgi:2-iminobutanoate/2-iminopropanoate deaminase